MNTAYTGAVRCPRCGQERPETAAFAQCPECRDAGVNVNSMPVYDLSRLDGAAIKDDREPGVFRYRALLPIQPDTRAVSLGEGDTPLVPLPVLANEIGVGRILLKDESRNPTWSYKDRLAAVAVTKAREAGAETVVVSSTGNHGAAVAAYAAAAGLRCVVLTLESVPATMKVLMQSYGAHVVALSRPTDRWVLMQQLVDESGWVPMSGYVTPPAGSNPFGVDGYKTMAYEIVDELGDVPDVVITPVAYGDGIAGLGRGFRDLLDLGLVDRLPRLVAAEVFGPYEHALRLGTPGSAVQASPSVAFSIATPIGSFQGYHAIEQSEGTAQSVSSDEDIMAAQQRLARTSGLYLEASAALPVAVLPGLRERGAIGATDTVVCIGTATGLKDFAATAALLPPVEVIEPTLAELERTMAALA